jgi:HD-GYP domain-containing protein (c-di-GMP phosphodiesterase class II)
MAGIEDQFAEQVARHGRSFITNLSILLKVTDIYSSKNETVLNAAERFLEDLHPLMGDNEDLTVKVADQSIFIEDLRVKAKTTDLDTFGYLMSTLENLSIGSLTFSASLTLESLTETLDVILKSTDLGELQSTLESGHGGRVKVGGSESAVRGGDIDLNDTRLVAKRSYGKAVAAIMEMRKSMTTGRPMNFRQAKRSVQSLVDNILREETYLLWLTAPRTPENYFLIHSVDVFILSIAIGRRIGFNKYELSKLGLAALFHDIGMIDREIVSEGEGAPVLSDEMAVLREHPQEGFRRLLKTRGLSEDSMLSMMVAFEHHKNVDLTGYPETSEERMINVYSRIVHVSEDFDNLTNWNFFGHVPLGIGEALGAMSARSGSAYDGNVLKILTGLCPQY